MNYLKWLAIGAEIEKTQAEIQSIKRHLTQSVGVPPVQKAKLFSLARHKSNELERLQQKRLYVQANLA